MSLWITFWEGEGEVFEQNITHNLTDMADAVNLYVTLWRPETKGYTLARHLLDDLHLGIKDLHEHPEECKKLNPSNGWGTYEGFLLACERIEQAARDYPDATIHVSR